MNVVSELLLREPSNGGCVVAPKKREDTHASKGDPRLFPPQSAGGRQPRGRSALAVDAGTGSPKRRGGRPGARLVGGGRTLVERVCRRFGRDFPSERGQTCSSSAASCEIWNPRGRRRDEGSEQSESSVERMRWQRPILTTRPVAPASTAAETVVKRLRPLNFSHNSPAQPL